MTGEERLEFVDVARAEHALGEDDDVGGTVLVPRRLEDPVSQVQVQQLSWCELEEAMRLALDRPGRLEVLRVDAQRPWQHQHVPLLCRAVWPDSPRRDPVPDRVDLGAPDADVARQRADRGAAYRVAYTREDPEPLPADPREGSSPRQEFPCPAAETVPDARYIGHGDTRA